MDSVLEAVDRTGATAVKPGSVAAAAKKDPIIPGARTFEELEDIIKSAKKEKKEKMKEKIRGYVKPGGW